MFRLNWKFVFIFNKTHLISDKTTFIWQPYTKIRRACLFTHIMYRKVLLSSFHNGKVEYCETSDSGDIEENASALFFYSDIIYLLSI